MHKQPTKSDWFLIVLFFVIGFPVTFSGYDYSKGLWEPTMDTLVYTVATLFLSYIIVYKFFPRFFPEKQIIRLFIYTVILMIVVGAIEIALYQLIDGRSLKVIKTFDLIFWAISSSAQNAGILIGILLGKKFYDAQVDLQKKEKEMKDSELRRLKAQVDPHFLFNNLNTVDALIDSDPKVAKSYLKHLSELYRYLIRTKDDEVVSLSDEMEFAQNYIFLIEKRFGVAYQFHVRQIDNFEDYLIPPGALQTVLENVVKHNSGSDIAPIITEIKVQDDKVVVSNNKSVKIQNRVTTSTGLNNLKSRYNLLTELKVVVRDNEMFEVSLPILKSVEE